MNIQLDKRLGKIWLIVHERLSLQEVNEFRDAAFKAKDFDDLPLSYKDLVLEIEGRLKEKAA